jgi:hypothetical protein
MEYVTKKILFKNNEKKGEGKILAIPCLNLIIHLSNIIIINVKPPI